MPGIGIIANPHSKLNKRNPQQGEILGYTLGQKGILKMTNTLDELAQVAREFKRQNIDILAINGGDGTVSRTITAFQAAYAGEPLPPVALLKGGTMNAVAQNLKLRGGPESILYRLVEAYSSGSTLKIQRLRTLEVDGGTHGFIFANGVATNFLREFYKNKTGRLGAIALVLDTYWKGLINSPAYQEIVTTAHYQLIRSRNSAEEYSITDHISCCLMAATVPKLPLSVSLFSKHWLGLDEIKLVSFTSNPRQLLWRLPAIFLSSWLDSDLFRLDFGNLTIRADEPFWYTVDGELFESKTGCLDLRLGSVVDFVVI